MGTQYTNDRDLGDYIIGQATGVGYNAYSNLGAQHHQPAYTPPAVNVPTRQQSGGQQRFHGAAASAPTYTPEQIAEAARRRTQHQAFLRKAPFFKRLSGHVVSWLNADGQLLVGDEGDLATSEIVKRREHLRRMEAAYRDCWEKRFARFSDSDVPNADHYLRDAEERLDLLKRGRFLAPVDRKGRNIQFDLYEKRKRFFRTRIVRRSVHKVGLSEYERRFRKYIDGVYNPWSFCAFMVGDTMLKSHRAKDAFRFYLLWPYSHTLPE